MTEREGSDSLRPTLREAEAELKARLEEACAVTEPVSRESTAELIRLEETLSDAARAAKETVSLRRQLHAGASESHSATGLRSSTTTADAPSGDESFGNLREFTETGGTAWRVWEVVPDVSRKSTFTADFVAGWLCFETLDGRLSRRLPHYPPDWRELPDEKLQVLLYEARASKRRGLGRKDESE